MEFAFLLAFPSFLFFFFLVFVRGGKEGWVLKPKGAFPIQRIRNSGYTSIKSRVMHELIFMKIE